MHCTIPDNVSHYAPIALHSVPLFCFLVRVIVALSCVMLCSAHQVSPPGANLYGPVDQLFLTHCETLQFVSNTRYLLPQMNLS